MADLEINVRGQLLQALAQTDEVERRISFRRLRNINRPATLHAIVRALDSDDETLVLSAASVLPIVGPCPEISSYLINNLRRNPSPTARQACTRELSRIDSPQVTAALFSAMADTDDGVVTIICSYLAARGGCDAIEALNTLLGHPSWQVRLCACVALMNMDVRCTRLTNTLETLASQPEAAQHDAVVAECDELMELRGGIYRDEMHVNTMKSLINRARTDVPQARWAA